MKKTWIMAAALVASAVAWRIVNWRYGLAPNLEVVTASSLVAAVFLTRRMALVVPVAIMVASDLVIGNTSILLFTWSGFAVIGLAGLMMRSWRTSPGKLMLASVAGGVAASVFYFLYTNFGVWLLGDGTMYAKTWSGLMECYAMGLPFYRTMLLGNVVLVPTYVAAALYGPALVRRIFPQRAPVTD